MRYKLLGKSGLRVSSLCLGTMGFLEGSTWGPTNNATWGSSKAESQRIFDAFMTAGGNFIDSANTYGASEEWLGEFMAADRDRVVLTTKYTGANDTDDVNCSGSHRKNMQTAVEKSLKRLKTDYIDVLCVHSWDYMTPVEEVMRALDDLIRQGKVLYIAVSNAPAWIVAQANTLSDLRGWSPFIAVHVEYNLLERDVDRDLLPMAQALDIGVAAWTPLSSGWLTGKYLDEQSSDIKAAELENQRRLDDPIMGRFVQRNDRNRLIAEEVRAVATEIGCSPAHVALNWVIKRGVIPIFGARNAEQVTENTACLEFELSDEHFQRLNEISKIRLGYPHAFLASGIVKKFMYGGMFDFIDDHRNLRAS